MYELKIKDRLGVWHSADLLEEETPAMNYQINNLAELKDRQASYSQALKLPKTKKNVGIFERADIFEATTNLPYDRLECRLFSNGYTLAGKGSVLIIDNITEYINVQILAGNADLFDTLDALNITDVDLGSTIVDSSNYDTWVRRANCILGYYNELPKNGYTYFLNLFTTVTKVLASLGYTISHNLPTTTVNNHYFNIPSRQPKEDSLTMFNTKTYLNYSTQVNRGSDEYTYCPLQIDNSGQNILTLVDGNINKWKGVYTSNINGKIRIFVGLTGTSTSQQASGSSDLVTHYRFNASKNSNSVVSYDVLLASHEDQNFEYFNTVDIDVAKGDIITFTSIIWIPPTLNNSSRTIIISEGSNFTTTEIEADEVPTGGKLYFGNNTVFETGLDLFKTFAQTYGLTIDVDNVNKVVKAYTMNKLYYNKRYAIDWSNKLHLSNEREISFTLNGYAKTNNIKFAKKDDIEDIGTFEVADANIEKTKDLFTLKWESGIDKLFNGLNLADIPLYKYNSNTEVDREIQDGKPHLVAVLEKTTNILWFHSQIWVANHIPAQYLIDTYYVDLTSKMLVNAKRIEALFNLTEIDIEDFDPFIPIYISYYGAYFYVEKINNFQKGKLTKVNLIKL